MPLNNLAELLNGGLIGLSLFSPPVNPLFIIATSLTLALFTAVLISFLYCVAGAKNIVTPCASIQQDITAAKFWITRCSCFQDYI